MLLLLALFAALSSGQIAAHRVNDFPGYGAPDTPTWAGTLEVMPGVHFFYIFVESRNPQANQIVSA